MGENGCVRSTVICEPIMLEKLIAIDTGCVYKEDPRFGKLTAVVLPERRQ